MNRRLTTWPVTASSVWRFCAWESTSTLCFEVATFRPRFAVAFSLTFNVTFVRTVFSKPSSSADTVYNPGGIVVNTYRPLLSDVVANWYPFCWSTSVTFAPGTKAPLGSVMLPLRVPKYPWPKRIMGITNRMANSSPLRILRGLFDWRLEVATIMSSPSHPCGAFAAVHSGSQVSLETPRSSALEKLDNCRRHSRRAPSVPLMYAPLFNGLRQGITLHIRQDFHFAILARCRLYVHPPLLELSLSFFSSRTTPTAPEEPTLAPPGTEEPGSASLQAISQTPIPLLSPSLGLFPCRNLPGRHRQRTDPPYHARKQLPGQMALGQQQPVIPGVLDQSATRLHQSLLQARQRPVADPVWQHQPPPQIPQGPPRVTTRRTPATFPKAPIPGQMLCDICRSPPGSPGAPLPCRDALAAAPSSAHDRFCPRVRAIVHRRPTLSSRSEIAA